MTRTERPERTTIRMTSQGTTYTLRILHISDLHAGKPGKEHDWRRRRVLGTAWEENLKAIRGSGRPVDLVCFTGDAVWNGKDHYTEATEFFDETLSRLGVAKGRFFAVPGNHDVDRDFDKPIWVKLRTNIESVGAARLSDWVSGGVTPFGFDDGDREKILARSEAYRRWIVDEMGRPELDPTHSPHGRLGYRITLDALGSPSAFPFPVHIVGLNTAWLCGDDGDTGKLRLTDGQVGMLLEERLPGYRLVLAHHRLTDLADGAECRRLIAERSDLLLRGHLHEPDAELWSDPDRSLRENAAGCLYEHDRWPNSMQVIDVTLDSSGRPLRYDLWVRSWSKKGHWFDDSEPFEEMENGRLSLWTTDGKNWDRRRTTEEEMDALRRECEQRVFVERPAEMEQIRAALASSASGARRCVVTSLEGMPGVGKSYLARKFISLHSAMFPGGLLSLILTRDDTRDARSLALDLCEQLKLRIGGGDPWAHLSEALRLLPCLVLVENVDGEPQAKSVADLVDRLGDCPFLATGRFTGMGGAWSPVKIEPFGPEDGWKQIREELGPAIGRYDEGELRKLVEDLGGLPLAIHIAAGNLRLPGMTLDCFREDLNSKGLDIGHPAPADHLNLVRAEQTVRAVFETGLATLKRMLEENERAALADAFASLGVAPRAGFGRRLGAAICGLDEVEFTRLAVNAYRLSLLELLPDSEQMKQPAMFRVHPLLAKYLFQKMGNFEPAGRKIDWFVERLVDSERWNEVLSESSGFDEFLDETIRKGNPLALAFLARVGITFSRSNGPIRTWIRLCERGLSIDSDPARRISYLFMLTKLSIGCGNIERAEAAAREMLSLSIAEHDERNIALAEGAAADILMKRGNYDEALRIRQEKELPVFERLGLEVDRAMVMGRIADIIEMRADLDNAPYLDKALRIRREEELPVYKRHGMSRECAITAGNIADIHQRRMNFAEALRIRKEEELPVYERMGLVREHTIARGKIADIHESCGEFDEALRIRQEEELPVYERLEMVRERAVTFSKIAMVMARDDKLDKFDEALRILEVECLPAMRRLSDLELIAHARFDCAQIRYKRGGVTNGEAHVILEELAESYDIVCQMKWTEGLAFIGQFYGRVLAQTGFLDIALPILESSAVAYDKLERPEEATKVREFIENLPRPKEP